MKKHIIILALAAMLTGCGTAANTDTSTQAPETVVAETADGSIDFAAAGIKDNRVRYLLFDGGTFVFDGDITVSDEDAAEIINILNDDLTELNADIQRQKETNAEVSEVSLEGFVTFYTAGCRVRMVENDIVFDNDGREADKNIDKEKYDQIDSILRAYVEEDASEDIPVSGFDLTGIDDNTLYFQPENGEGPDWVEVVLTEDEAAEIIEMINSAPKEIGVTEGIDNVRFTDGDTRVYIEMGGPGPAVANLYAAQQLAAELTVEQKDRINEIIINTTGISPIE